MMYTPRQVSELLSIPVKTLERWRGERVGPPYLHAGRQVRYPRKDLERWIRDNTIRH